MNAQQAAFFRQAAEDWRVYSSFRRSRPRTACHELHYLQMATEKIAKAYRWGTSTPPRGEHTSFVVFLRMIADRKRTREALGLQSQAYSRAWIRASLPLAIQIENLAPALAGEGPNPEYPFPRALPLTAPVDHDFQVVDELDRPNGRKLITLVSGLFETFALWC